MRQSPVRASKRSHAQIVRDLVRSSTTSQGISLHVTDTGIIRSVAVLLARVPKRTPPHVTSVPRAVAGLIAHQPNPQVARKRTSAAPDRARSVMEDDHDRRPRAS